MPFLYEQPGPHRLLFRERKPCATPIGARADHERHGFGGVGLPGYGRGVIGHAEDSERPALLLHGLEHVAHHLLVEILDGPNLFLEQSPVARLVRRLHVDEDQVAGGERRDRCPGLAFVVGVYPARGPRDVDHLHAPEEAQALQEVHGRDHAPGDAVLGLEGGDLHPLAVAPGPDGGGLLLSGLSPGHVHGMVPEHFPGFLHELPQERVAGEVGRYALSGDVVGGGGPEAGAVVSVDHH